MNTKFKIDGCYELEITSDGYLRSVEQEPAASCAYSKGSIGIMLHYTPMVLSVDEADAKTVTRASLFLKRNQARAIASALLSAVSEAGE